MSNRAVWSACVCAGLLLAAAGPASAWPVAGRVLHGETGRPVTGVEVRVVAMEAGQPAVEAVGRTDARGRFRVEVQAAPRTAVVQVRYRGVTYTSGPHRREPGAREVTVWVFEPTHRPPPLALVRRALLLDHEQGWFVVREVAVVRNPEPRTYVGDPRAGGATWRLPLLRGAQDVRVVRGIVPAGVDPDGALVDTLPVHPGDRTAVFLYRVRARGPSLLELPVGLPTDSLDVFVPQPLQVRSAALAVREARQVEGRLVVWLQARRLPPEAVVALEATGVAEGSRLLPRVLAALLAGGCAVFVAWPFLAGRLIPTGRRPTL